MMSYWGSARRWPAQAPMTAAAMHSMLTLNNCLIVRNLFNPVLTILTSRRKPPATPFGTDYSSLPVIQITRHPEAAGRRDESKAVYCPTGKNIIIFWLLKKYFRPRALGSGALARRFSHLYIPDPFLSFGLG